MLSYKRRSHGTSRTSLDGMPSSAHGLPSTAQPAQQPHAFVLYAVATTEIDVKGKIFRLQSYVYTSGQHVINRFSMRPRGSGS